jgi:hypothetical protein
MSKCIVCNKQIPRKAYFCEECLAEQVGAPPKRGKLRPLSRLLLLPFYAMDFFVPWTGEDEKPHEWVAHRAYTIKTLFPQVPSTAAVDGICNLAGFESPQIREQSLHILREIEFGRISVTKKGIERAPWDIVFQPGIQILIIAMGLLGLFLLASSL